MKDLRAQHIGAVSLLCRIFGNGFDRTDEDHDSMTRLARDFNASGFGLEILKNGASWALFDRKEVAMKPTPEHQRLAQAIAERLFVSGGDGQRAQRLVLTVDVPEKRDLGGWGFKPMADRIAEVLAEEGADAD